jgi:hypothetical protein
MKFQYYSNSVQSSIVQDEISLSDFIDIHKDMSYADIFNKIRISNCKKERDEMKRELVHFTPAVIVKNCRRINEIISFTGLAQLDFDGIDNIDDVMDLKYHLFFNYKSIVCCYISPSQRGIKALMHIPVSRNIEEFREYYYGIASHFQKYKHFDDCPKNAVLPLFQSYDDDIYYRDISECQRWTLKGKMLNSFYENNVKTTKPFVIKSNDRLKEKLQQRIISMFDKIHDNGHPQLRSNALAIGGFVAFGYLNEYDALDLMRQCINSNTYLQKGLEGYHKTAKQSFELGKRKPLKI